MSTGETATRSDRPFVVEIRRDGTITDVTVAGVLDEGSAETLDDALWAYRERAGVMRFDLTGVSRVDPVAIGSIIGRCRRGEAEIVDGSPAVHDALRRLAPPQ